MLELSQDNITKLTFTDLQYIFDKANESGKLDETVDKFWSLFSKADNQLPTMQDVIFSLEQYKRGIGKYYAKTKSITAFINYNNVERQIKMLQNNYPLDRKYKPSSLKLPSWVQK